MNIVYIVEDEAAVSDALAWLFRSRGIDSRAFAGGQEVLDALAAPASLPACIVMDVRMPGMSGLEVFDRLQTLPASHVPVIFLTGHGDVPMAVEAVKKGAFDFFEKPFNDNGLVDRVVQACEAASQRAHRVARDADKQVRLATLSPREHEVMARILAGKLNKVVADELGISMRTVEVHRASIFAKLGVKSAVELAQWIMPLQPPVD
jgi:two-component system, LuxR family, response regulator DctR